jgi:hypothetical protein
MYETIFFLLLGHDGEPHKSAAEHFISIHIAAASPSLYIFHLFTLQLIQYFYTSLKEAKTNKKKTVGKH